MSVRNKVILCTMALAAAFLAGFAPAYLSLRRVRSEMRLAEEKIASQQFKVKICQLRNLAGLIYVEVCQKNYGIASEYSTLCFKLLREVADETSDDVLKRTLEDLLSHRHEIAAGLAKGDASIVQPLETFFMEVHEGTINY